MEVEMNTINSQRNISINEMVLSNSDKNSSEGLYYKAVKENLCCDLDGTAVILNMTSGKYYGINSVGSFIWSTIQTPQTFDQIQDLVMNEFDVESEICQKEVLSFLKKMAEQKLIEVSDEKTG